MPQDNPEMYRKLYDTGKTMMEQGKMLMDAMESLGYGGSEMDEEIDLGDEPEKAVEDYSGPTPAEQGDKKFNPDKEKKKSIIIMMARKKLKG